MPGIPLMSMMKRILLFSIWVGLAAYCALTSVVGPSGILALRQAQAAELSMQSNLRSLEALHESYATEWAGLESVPEMTALEARSLGYIAGDEVVVRMPFAAAPHVPPSPGERVSFEPHAPVSMSRIQELSAMAALVTMIMALGARLVAGRGVRNQREILLHDASRT